MADTMTHGMLMKRMALCLLCLAPTMALPQSASSESPAARSCHGSAFDIENDPSFITFSSHGYPAVNAKMSEDYDIDRLSDMVALGTFTGLAVGDMFVPLMTLACNHAVYDATGCRVNFLLRGKTSIENVSLVGERLSYKVIDDGKGISHDVVIGNRDLDSLTFTTTEGTGTTTSHWERAYDGTETYLGESGPGNVTRYTERPDCSGEGFISQAENGALRTTSEFTWTSTKASTFNFTYTLCNYASVQDCKSGSF